MIIKISEDKVVIDNNTFTKWVTYSRLDEHRNEVLSEVLEYLDSIEDELSQSIKDSDYQSLPLNQYVTEGNIYLLRSLKETIRYMKVEK